MSDELANFRAEHPFVETVDAVFCDLCGIMRGKRLRIEDAGKLWPKRPAGVSAGVSAGGSAGGGMRMPEGVFILSVQGENDDALGRGFSDGDPDCNVFARPGSLAPIPWLGPERAQVLLDFATNDGAPLNHDPRNQLSGVVDRLKVQGLFPTVALELEFYLLQSERDPVTGAPSPGETSTQVYAIDTIADKAEFLDAVAEACMEQGVPYAGAFAEYSPGQYEVNLHHTDDILAAADQAVLLKRIIQGVAKGQGMRASFMARPFKDHVGCGQHVHVSMRDAKGKSLFAQTDGDESLPMRHAIGGLFETWPEAQSIYAPNINSFRRFSAEDYAPVNRTWGVEHRLLTARIPDVGAENRRFEWRVPGADANPYLVLAAVLASIGYGIANEVDPGPMFKGQPKLSADPKIPWNQQDALESTMKSKTLSDWFSADYLKLYAETKRLERAHFDAMISRAEYDWYLLTDV